MIAPGFNLASIRTKPDNQGEWSAGGNGNVIKTGKSGDRGLSLG